MDLLAAYKGVLDALFTKYAETITDCQANRQLVAENVDGVNFALEHFEEVLRELVSSGAILAKPSRQQIEEAELERSKAAKKIRADYRDDIRKLRAMSREDLEFELKRRRKEEAAGRREANPLLEKSVEELKAIIQEQEASKNRRPGIEPLPLKIRLRYQPNVEVVLDARGIKSLDSDELRYLGQRFGFDQVNERIAATAEGEMYE